jgi:two-component system chemotaxis sensor kinase CheA
MVVRVGKEHYIIPSVKIVMSVAPEPGMISTLSGKGEMVRLQGQMLPVLRLGRHWNVPGAEEDLTKGLLVIVGSGTRRAALLVDDLVTQQQFVVKPLTGLVSKTPGISGGAIMGSGDVGLILDPEAVVEAALSSPTAA